MEKVGRSVLVFLSVALSVAFIACNQKKADTEQKETVTDAETLDTMHLKLSVAEIDTMTVIFTDTDKKSALNQTDINKLGDLLSVAVNDTAWNNSGIMVKMVAPEYTLISHYKGKSPDENGWLMIWKEGDRIKFENKWYLLAAEKKTAIFQLLDTYK